MKKHNAKLTPLASWMRYARQRIRACRSVVNDSRNKWKRRWADGLDCDRVAGARLSHQTQCSLDRWVWIYKGECDVPRKEIDSGTFGPHEPANRPPKCLDIFSHDADNGLCL